MATAGALASNAQLITQLLGGAKTLFGSSSNTTVSGGTSTTQTMLSQDAVNALLKDLLESDSGGLARVASGARIPGLYNTTSQQLMVNDLLARSAAQVAKASAPTVTTTSPKTTTVTDPGLISGSLGKLALTGAGAYGLKKLFDGIGSSGGATADLIGQSLNAGDFIGNLGNPFDIAANDWLDFGGDFVGSMSGVGSTGADLFGLGDAAGGFPFLSSASNLIEGDFGGLVGTGIGWLAGGPVGAFVGNILGGDGGIGGFMDSVGGIVEGVGDFIGDTVDAFFGGCYITTATCKLYGKPDDCHELTMMRKFRDEFVRPNYPKEVEDYYATAPEIVKKIESREDANTIWADLYRHYIVPAVAFAQDGLYEQTYEVYTEMVKVAKGIANG